LFDTNKDAIFTGDHRLWLRRRVAIKPIGFKPSVFVLHNPSTANADDDDATSRKGQGFAERWGYTDMIFTNVVTRCATDAKDLTSEGLTCRWADYALRQAFKIVKENNGILIAAWGTPKGKAAVQRAIIARIEHVTEMAKQAEAQFHAIRVSPNGWPEHPLYLPYELEPTLWP